MWAIQRSGNLTLERCAAVGAGPRHNAAEQQSLQVATRRSKRRGAGESKVSTAAASGDTKDDSVLRSAACASIPTCKSAAQLGRPLTVLCRAWDMLVRGTVPKTREVKKREEKSGVYRGDRAEPAHPPQPQQSPDRRHHH